jgi:membrane protein
MNFKNILEFLKAIFAKWGQDDATRLAASLAFFAVLSLAPLLLIITAIIGLVYGEGEAQAQLVAQARNIVGPEGAQVFEEILSNAAEGGVTAGIVGFVAALFGASNVFVQLQNSLNVIWDVAPNPKLGIKHTIRTRLFAFAIVLGIGLLLLASLALSVVIRNLEALIGENFFGGPLLWQLVNILISLGTFTLIFAVIFKVIPDVKIRWHDVWLGAGVTAVLFTIGRELLSLYLSTGAIASVYGAIGSLVVLLIWIFYSTQILFFGAEFTQVYSKVRGEAIAPDDHALPLPEERQQKREQIAEHIAKARDEDPDEVGREALASPTAPTRQDSQKRSQSSAQRRRTPTSNTHAAPARASRQSPKGRQGERKITPLGFVAGAVVAASRLFGKGKDGRTAAKKRRK